FSSDGDARDLPSLPTRRSSDLDHRGGADRRHFLVPLVRADVRPLLCDSGAGVWLDLWAVWAWLRRRTVGANAASSQPSVRTRAADRKRTRLNSSHVKISYAVFC